MGLRQIVDRALDAAQRGDGVRAVLTDEPSGATMSVTVFPREEPLGVRP